MASSISNKKMMTTFFDCLYLLSILLKMFTSMCSICNAKKEQNSSAGRNFEDHHGPEREANFSLSCSQSLALRLKPSWCPVQTTFSIRASSLEITEATEGWGIDDITQRKLPPSESRDQHVGLAQPLSCWPGLEAGVRPFSALVIPKGMPPWGLRSGLCSAHDHHAPQQVPIIPLSPCLYSPPWAPGTQQMHNTGSFEFYQGGQEWLGGLSSWPASSWIGREDFWALQLMPQGHDFALPGANFSLQKMGIRVTHSSHQK